MKFTLRDSAVGRFFTSAFNHLFPEFASMQRSFFLNTSTRVAKWIAHGNLWKLYTGIPHLNTVINTRAELFSQGKIRIRDIKTKEEKFTHKALTLLSKPNPIQSGPEYLTMYLVFKDIYGNVPILKNGVMKSQPIPGQLWNLPPEAFKIKTTGKLWRQVNLSDIIEGYELQDGGETLQFKPEEIILKNDNLGGEYLFSESKLLALIKPLSNIDASLRTANILINDHGAYGIISNGGKDSMGGSIPFSEGEKELIEERMGRRYGNKPGQKQNIVTNATITYTPIGSPLSEMLLDKEIEQNFGIIIGAYFLDRDIFPNTQGATFENKKQARISVIQNTIQSEADDLMMTLNSEFRLIEEGLELYMTFDHLPIMQEDESKRAEVINKIVDSLSKGVTSGFLSSAQAQDLLKKLCPKIKIEDKLGKPDDKWYLYAEQNKSQSALDSLGKIPLALQQLALARERANTANDAALSEQLRQAMDQLTIELVNTIVNPPKA